jgi:uncharacterized protein YndB with AHSA1/START domain
MNTLFTDQTITIHASPATIWQIITEPRYTKLWANEFTGGAPFYIESGWKLNDPVIWKDENDKIVVEGTVTAHEYGKLLRFTVFAANAPHAAVKEDDGITWQLRQKGPNTELRVRQGDFSSVKGGEKNYEHTEQIWSRVLPKIKKLAEDSSA